MSLGNISTEGNPGWEMVYNVLSPDHGNKSSGFPLVADRVCVVTKPRWETLRPGTVRLMECCMDSTPFQEGASAYVERIGKVELHREMLSNMSVVEGCQPMANGDIEVLVANEGREPINIPPSTRFATASMVSWFSEAKVAANQREICVEVSEVASVFGNNLENVNLDRKDLVDQSVEPNLLEMPPGVKLYGVHPDYMSEVKSLLYRRREAFSHGPYDLGKCDLIPHEIRLSDPRPVNLPHRRIAPHLIQEVREQLVDRGIIQKSSSSYASPVVPIRKKDRSLRFCIDYRQLNERTTKDAFPLPKIEESLEALLGAKVFTSLDLSQGYFQLTMHPNSIPYTAFRVPWRLFEFTRLPQGLCTSPGTFQRVMEFIFGDMNMLQLLLYLDDVLVFASSYEEHITRLDEVLRRLVEAGLKLNGKKCKFFQTKLTYLGHIVSDQGISVDPDKVEKVRLWPLPQTLEELASFLGLASYYRRFIPGFSSIASTLHALKSGHVYGKGASTKFQWTPEAEEAFLKLKVALTEAPVLVYPQYDKTFFVEVDASFQGLGACLSQMDACGRLHPIAYASRGLRGSERNYPDYSSFKLELLGLKWAIADKFGDHLMGHECVVLTDNDPLAHLATAKLGATEQRWVAKLAPYNLKIRYRSGSSNRVADALSRHPLNKFDVSSFVLVQEGTLSTPCPLTLREAVVMPDKVRLNESEIPGILPSYSIGVSRGGGQGVLTPPFPGPPLFICDPPPPTQPDLTDECNVNCFLIV